MKDSNAQISATEFKKHFLNLVDQVKNKRNSFIITKRKLPVAKIVPLGINKVENRQSYFGFLKGTIKINDDIVNCSFESGWETSND